MKQGLLIYFFVVCVPIGLRASVVDTTRWADSAVHLNSVAAESSPLLSADGQTLYFVRRNHIQNIGEEDRDDIWVSYRDSVGNWSSSVNIGAPLNNEQNNKVVGVSLSNETIYLTGDQNDKVYFSRSKNRSWSKPTALELPEFVNEAGILNCHIGIDESNLLLSIANKDCLGKRDLFICRKDPNGKWQAPFSLGPLINTSGDEGNAFLAADNRTLYFCTDGRGGIGGYDWFISIRLDETWSSWSEPVNLGSEINTTEDDLDFCINTAIHECYGTVRSNDANCDIKRMVLSDEKMMPSKTFFIYGKVQSVNGETVQSLVNIQLLQHAAPSASVNTKSDGKFLALLGEQQKAGFYVNAKNSYAAMSYINLSGQPLKVLDSGVSNYLSPKDSAHVYAMESIQIRLNELDCKLKSFTANRPNVRSSDISSIQNFLKQSSDFEVDQKIEKIRRDYNLKYGKTAPASEKDPITESNNELPESSGAVPGVEDIAHSNRNPEKIQLMKKGFEDQKRKKEGGSSVTPDAGQAEEISEEEARKAIEELSQIDAGHQKAIPDFEVLLANMKNRIVADEFSTVRAGMERDLIWEWNGWKELGFSAAEEKKVKGKVEEVQRQVKGYFEQKNHSSLRPENVDRVLYDDDKIIYDELRSSVINSMYLFMKEDIKREIDYEMKVRFYTELINQLSRNLEKEKRPVGTLFPTVVPSQQSEAFSGNERTTNVTIQLYPLTEGKNIPLSGIFFQSDSDVLLPESNAELSRVKELLDAYPSSSIEIGSHTHGYCAEAFADDITERRCKSIKQSLIGLGVESARIFTVAYGKKVPLVPNNTKEGRLKNQRTEMRMKR